MLTYACIVSDSHNLRMSRKVPESSQMADLRPQNHVYKVQCFLNGHPRVYTISKSCYGWTDVLEEDAS